MPALADLVINLTAETASLSTKLDAANRDVQKFARNVGREWDSLKSVGESLITALAIERVGGWVKGIAEVEDHMGKLAQSYGVAVGTLSAYSYAANISSVDQDTLARAMGLLAKAADANKPAFDRLGIATRDSSGQLRPLSDLMLDVADRFSKMQDGTAKTALALQLFGRGGAALIPFLDQGRDGIRALTDEAYRLGKVLTDVGTASATAFMEGMKRLQATVDGLSIQFMNGLFPALNQIIGVADVSGLRGAESAGASFGVGLLTTIGTLEDFGYWIDVAAIKLGKYSMIAAAMATGGLTLVSPAVRAQLKALDDQLTTLDATHAAQKADLFAPHLPPALPKGGTGNASDTTKPAGDTAKQKDYTAALKTFLDEVNAIELAAAKASDDALAQINLKWEERRTKLETDFKKLSAALQNQYAITYRFEQGQIFGGKQAEINAEFAKIPKLLEAATKAADEFVLSEAKMKPFPNFGFGGPAAMPNFMSDQVGAQLDRFRNDQSAQNALMDRVFKDGLSMAQQYNVELAKLDIAWGQLPPAIKASLEAQDAYSKAVGSLKDRLDVNTMAMKDFSEQSFEAVKGALMMSGSWSNALKAIAADLAEMILKMTVLKELNAAGGSSGGGWLGALTGVITNMLGGGSGAVTTSLNSSIFHPGPVLPPTGPSGILGTLPGFASGGDVAPNEWVTVGEHGPEPFHAGPSGGTVYPHGSAAPGGQANVQVVVNNQGSPKDAQVGKARFDRAARQFVVEVVMTDVRQNGPLRGLMGR